MRQLIVEFTDQDRKLLRELGIAIFRGKIISEAQPPITEAQLAEVEQKVDGKVPPELLALWKTSFGGRLDYDYEVMFGDHLCTASFRELFYPGSDHYSDLHGWIDHEVELAQEMAEEQEEPLPERTSYLPFGGFEYLERFYVSLEPDEYGTVLAYARGIPWKGRLNEDSVAVVARSVFELFDQLALDEDPFGETTDEYANGKEMAERICEIESDHPQLAKKLRELVKASDFDWQGILEKIDFATPLSMEGSKALRSALQHAVGRRDVSIIDWLHSKGAPFSLTLRGTGGVLNVAMARQSFDVVRRLLDLGVELGQAPILDATDCPDDLIVRLIEYGVWFEEDAIYSAAETGAIAGAVALANSGRLFDQPKSVSEIAAAALDRAASHEEDASKVEIGALGSYLTPQQYRERSAALRAFANRLVARQ